MYLTDLSKFVKGGDVSPTDTIKLSNRVDIGDTMVMLPCLGDTMGWLHYMGDTKCLLPCLGDTRCVLHCIVDTMCCYLVRVTLGVNYTEVI